MHTTRNTAAIPNYTARLAAFLEQKPSDEEMYRFLAEMDAEAHKWLAKHSCTDAFRSEAALFEKCFAARYGEQYEMKAGMYDRWPLYGPCLLHVGEEYQMYIRTATIRESCDELIDKILSYDGALTVLSYWNMGENGVELWCHNIPSIRTKPGIEKERRYLHRVLSQITNHGGNVLLWRYTDETLGRGKFMGGWFYDMAEFRNLYSCYMREAIAFIKQTVGDNFPSGKGMRGFPDFHVYTPPRDISSRTSV